MIFFARATRKRCDFSDKPDFHLDAMDPTASKAASYFSSKDGFAITPVAAAAAACAAGAAAFAGTSAVCTDFPGSDTCFATGDLFGC